MTLTDSNGTVVKQWTGLSAIGSRLTVNKTASGVVKGETYTLTFTATVNAGTTETISESTASTY